MTVSATLAINQEIARRRAAGHDTIPLGFGEASIPIHPELTRRLGVYAELGGYGPVAGIPALLDAAAGYWSRRGVPTRADQVVAGPGSKPLLYAVLQALGGPVALPRPSWVSYAAQNALLNQESVLIDTLPGQGGVPDPRALEVEAVRRRRAGAPLSCVLVTMPDNPTGTVAAPAVVRELCAVAQRQDLMVISDEIYLDLVHDAATSVLTPSELVPDLTITTTGLSKSLALGGWRIGVARFPDTDRGALLQQAVTTAASEIWSTPAHPVQAVAAWAFTEPVELRDHLAHSRRLHGAVAWAAAEVFRAAGASVPQPAAGFYLYPDFTGSRAQLARLGIRTSGDLAAHLLDKLGIATLPGSAFGDVPERLTLRIATPMLYGPDETRRWQALRAEDPTALPWLAESLATVGKAVSGML
ncbi:pyridoxal phosphate-dependent aminotransferase [Nocardioides speluncae]|uniref:pyridoxal phosphate-dependent aminotransferase n=1 Tax=Nocardioides speluncae TaxID=2670337 RepID=UPI000D68FDA3|nr:pyridoxal phosphate-dependent aminotransferase [Nocardioides speluncae]